MEGSNDDNQFLSAGLGLAAMHRFEESTPLFLCLVIQDRGTDPGELVLIQEQAGSRSYWGVVCDREGRIHDFLEVSVQHLQSGAVQHSAKKHQITNNFLDTEWRVQSDFIRKNPGNPVIATGFEFSHPPLLLIKRPSRAQTTPFWDTEFLPWELCHRDEVLEKHGLPRYSTTRFRYLHNPGEETTKTFIAIEEDSPATSQTVRWDKFKATMGNQLLFNSHCGLIRVTRLRPLDLETAAQIVEGKAWKVPPAQEQVLVPGELGRLHKWSHNPKGLPFRLHSPDQAPQHLHESLLIKLSLLLSATREVRRYVKQHQLPMLNLTPDSFGVSVAPDAPAFPRLWAARCHLIRPGQAVPLEIASTEQRYFLRFGNLKPSPYTPEGVGFHSFGIGQIQIRNRPEESNGIVLEGTLVAEDYLGLDPHDLLWFKLPLGEETIEFHAHVFKSESRSPREARFRTVPARLTEPTIAKLKESVGIRFPRSPYEVWPLLSSPCDLYSIGVLAVRLLLCDDESNLPAVLDEVLSLARRAGEPGLAGDPLDVVVRQLCAAEPGIKQVVYAGMLNQRNSASNADSQVVSEEIYTRILCLLLKLFPGTGAHAYCKSFGDVSPLALETVFDQPLNELELNLSLIRSLLVTNIFENEEISNVILRQVPRQ